MIENYGASCKKGIISLRRLRETDNVLICYALLYSYLLTKIAIDISWINANTMIATQKPPEHQSVGSER